MEAHDQEKTELAIYKILNDRVDSEIDELYTVHKVFLLVAGALLAMITNKFGNSQLHIAGGLTGIVVAYYWWKGCTSQEKWKRWWIEQTTIVERQIDSFQIWGKIAYDKALRDDREDVPPAVASVSNPMRIMPIIFGMTCLASLICGIIIIWLE